MYSGDRSPAEVAAELDILVQRKVRETTVELVLFGVLAGVYIGFGAAACTTVVSYEGLPTGLAKLLSASIFCVGLVLVIVPGSELFTGNILMTTGLVGGKVRLSQVFRNWVLVYGGNFIGSVGLAALVYGTGLLGVPGQPTPVGAAAAAVAKTKISLPLLHAFLRGVLCNMLVCLAVIMSLSSRTTTGKILGIYFPITTFVLCGFEHSVANMYLLPAGLLAEGRFTGEFLTIFRNLIPVTAGNIIGGMLIVGLHPVRVRQLRTTLRALSLRRRPALHDS